VIASICEPSDLGGLPVIDNGGVRRVPASWALELEKLCRKDEQAGVMLFDELSTAAPANQAAVLRISQERVVGDLTLPYSVRFVAAANPVEESAGGWDLSAPLANRLCHLRWHLPPENWIKGMAASFPAPALVPVDPNWEHEIGVTRSLMASFIRAQPQKLIIVPKDDSQKGHAWPSPRTWDMGSRLLACGHTSDPGTKMELLAGCVGDGAAIEFMNWLERLDLPSPEKVWKLPKKYYVKPKKDEEYKMHAILGAALSIGQRTPGAESWTKGWELLAHAAQWNPDVAASYVPLLVVMRGKGKDWPVPSVAHGFMQKMGKSMEFWL
jgi:hypothetical protein